MKFISNTALNISQINSDLEDIKSTSYLAERRFYKLFKRAG